MVPRGKKQSHQPKKPKNSHDSIDKPQDIQTFTHHIRELRRRLFWSVVLSVVIGSLVYYYHDFFIKIVMTPLHGQKLIYLNPGGGFSFIFMVTFYITMLFALPFMLYQIYAFIRPAIPKHTSMLSLKVGLAAMVLMACGATFGYLYAVPAGLNFLNNFANEYVMPSLTADSYLSFVLGYVLGIGILFELPLLLLFWHWIRPITPKGLLNSERFVIVGAFIAAAVLSPSPDALTQTIIAVPIIIVYQFGVIAVLVTIRKTRRMEKAAAVKNAPAPLVEETRELLVAPVSKPVPTPVVAIKPTPRRAVSMDGMTNPTQQMKKPQVVRPARVTAPSRESLLVPRRKRVISDFGPVRRSAIDTNQ